MKKIITKNYKYLIGLTVGIFISITVVYASSYFGVGADLNYDNSESGLISTNVQDALEELHKVKKTGCPIGYTCEEIPTYDYTALTLGDYINYTPPTTSFTTDTSYTGCTSSSYCNGNTTQTINPSELTTWRVISKNEDGTVDIVSEYVSSTGVYFYGFTGYKNLVLGLRTLANAYKDDGTLISSARPFGYSNQLSTCLETVNIVNNCSDTGYTTDYNLVNTVLGTRVANKVGTSTATTYWMASRYVHSYCYAGRNVYTSGSVSSRDLYEYNNGASNWSGSASLRIILTLKSGINYISAGENAWDIRA